MIALALLLFAAAPPAAPPPPASPTELLRQARDNFAYGSYQAAATIADRLAGARLLERPADQIEALRLLGLARFFLGDPDRARQAFVNLLSLDPDYQLDPFYVPPQAIAFFEKIRRENEALLTPIRERRRATQEAQRLEDEARARLLAQTTPPPAAAPRVVRERVERRSPAVALLPFGAGQFQNGNSWLGFTLLGAELATAAASVVAYAWIEQQRLPDGNFRPQDTAAVANVRTAQISTGALFYALWAFGIGEAFWHFSSTVVVPEGRSGPDGEKSPVHASLDPLPGGAAGSLAVEF